jgi:transcriptional regulator with XRE-family HTH domain
MKLSEQVGVSYQQVQKYEMGSDISVERLKQIARAINVPITLFFPGAAETAAEAVADYGKITEDETYLLTLYRRIKSRKAKKAVIELLKTFTKP